MLLRYRGKYFDVLKLDSVYVGKDISSCYFLTFE